MSSTIGLSIPELVARGHYHPSLAFPAGGWTQFYTLTKGEVWSKYTLLMGDVNNDDITCRARNTQCARQYFADNFTLPEHYEIVRSFTTAETVYSQ